MDKQQAIKVCRTLLGMTVTFGIALLVIRFLVGVAEPGNQENQNAFRMLAFILTPLDALTDILAAPVRMVIEPVSVHLPSRGWFPQTSVGTLIADINEFLLGVLPGIFTNLAPVRGMLTANYAYWLPGVLDWTLLLTIPLLSLAEHWITRLLDSMDKNITTQKREAGKAELARSYGLDTGVAVVTTRKKKEDEKKHQQEKRQAQMEVQQVQQDQAYRAMISSLKGELSRLQQRVEPLEKVAQTDALTGLRNRAFFDQTLNMELAQAKASQGFLGLIMIDIDNFKHLNDTLGHAAGDTVLKIVAEVVAGQEIMPGMAFPCRYGGEEIGVIVTQTTPDSLNRYAHTLCYEISTAYFQEYPSLRVTASIGAFGVKFRPDNGSQPLSEQDIIKQADARLYESKHGGKNQAKVAILS